MKHKSILPKLLLLLALSVVCNGVFAQVQTLQVTKPISAEDAAGIQAILNNMNKTNFDLQTKTTDGQTFIYGKPKGQVVAGQKIMDIKTFQKSAAVHTTIKDFFLRLASADDKAQLDKLKTILAKYN
ncbi:MAG TPA: hypothetical protein VGM30_17560 [Puia sp.]|jgi:hypothetical protein